MSIEEARKKINEIDREMARLYELRMEAVEEVVKYKMANGLPVLDRAREEEVIARNSTYIASPALLPYYVDFMESTMRTSREYQRAILSENGCGEGVMEIRTERFSYPVYFLPGGLSRIGELFMLDRRVLLLTDDGVPKEYVSAVAACCREAVIFTACAGEQSKSLSVYAQVEELMLRHGFTRGDCLVAVGGGVVGDLGGFVASTYMRGIDFYNVPTTSLSMVDSSVGGKTAINFDGTKNILGTFYPPRGVLIDRETLRTLPQRQLLSGLAEAIKMAVAFDEELFSYLERCELSPEALDTILYRSVSIKAKVVEEDEREGGKRKLLNLGHTLGHAIEAKMQGELTHGEAVALGMLAFSSPKVKERLLSLYKKFGYPTKFPASLDEILPLVLRDKKRAEGGMDAVVVEEVGSAKVVKIPLCELTEYISKKFVEEDV